MSINAKHSLPYRLVCAAFSVAFLLVVLRTWWTAEVREQWSPKQRRKRAGVDAVRLKPVSLLDFQGCDKPEFA